MAAGNGTRRHEVSEGAGRGKHGEVCQAGKAHLGQNKSLASGHRGPDRSVTTGRCSARAGPNEGSGRRHKGGAGNEVTSA